MTTLEIKHNLNLDLLKAFCAFLVIVAHFGNDCPLYMRHIVSLAVPIFIIISSYFFFKKITTIDIKKRFVKLSVPLVGWSIIYFIIYLLLGKSVTIKDFLWQLSTGHSPVLNPSMWFSNNLIILTLFFFLLFRNFKNYFFQITLFLLFFSYLLEYSGINYKLFENLRYEIKYPLGRLTEMIPFMVTGILLAKYNIFDRLRKKFLFLLIPLFYLTQKYFFLPVPNGFNYAGIQLLLLSVLLVLIFASIPKSKTPYDTILHFITQNTMGIYCIHRLTETFLHSYFPKENLFYCCLIYFISFTVCLGISKIPAKYIQMLVKNS